MGTVVLAPASMGALPKGLGPRVAVHIVQPNPPGSPTKVRTAHWTQGLDEAQLPADHFRFAETPPVVTHRAPGPIIEHLHAPLLCDSPANQADFHRCDSKTGNIQISVSARSRPAHVITSCWLVDNLWCEIFQFSVPRPRTRYMIENNRKRKNGHWKFLAFWVANWIDEFSKPRENFETSVSCIPFKLDFYFQNSQVPKIRHTNNGGAEDLSGFGPVIGHPEMFPKVFDILTTNVRTLEL